MTDEKTYSCPICKGTNTERGFLRSGQSIDWESENLSGMKKFLGYGKRLTPGFLELAGMAKIPAIYCHDCSKISFDVKK